MTLYLICTENELTLLCELGLLPSGMRRSVEDWMRLHGMNPDIVATRVPVRRDPTRATLSWIAARPDGTWTPHTRCETTEPNWPAPFPRGLRTDLS